MINLYWDSSLLFRWPVWGGDVPLLLYSSWGFSFTNLLWTYFFFKVLSSWPSLKMAACLWLELWGILCRLWKLWVKGTTEWGRSWCACSHPAIVKDTASRIWKSERTAWRNGWRRTTSLSPSREMHRGRCVWLEFWLLIRPMLQKIAAALTRSFCPAFGTLFKDISQLPSERGHGCGQAYSRWLHCLVLC